MKMSLFKFFPFPPEAPARQRPRGAGGESMSSLEMKLDFERADRRFESFGLVQAPLLYAGRRVPMKAIIKHGRVISIVGRGYKLLPNQLVREIVADIAETFNLEKSNRPKIGGYFEVMEKNDTRAFWTLTFPDEYRIGDERIFLGLQIRNSEDGSLSFGVDLFTFRYLCKNGAMVRTRDLRIKAYFKHTKHLTVDSRRIRNMIIQILDRGHLILDRYEQMMRIKMTLEVFEKLKRIPRKYFPEWLQAREPRAELLSRITEWDLYNDLTANIWHNRKLSMLTKRTLNTFLNKAFAIIG